MRTHATTTLAAVAATLVLSLALASTSATARRLSITEKEFEILFNREGLKFEAAGNSIACKVTLLGHFLERTIPKIVNSKIGVIRHVEPTAADEPPCTGGSLTILTETLPWTVNYVSFRGTLPRIEAIRYAIIGTALALRTNGLACLAGTTAREPAFFEQRVGTGGRVEGLRADETVGIRLGGGFLCEIAGSSHFVGTGSVLNLPGTAALTISLI